MRTIFSIQCRIMGTDQLTLVLSCRQLGSRLGGGFSLYVYTKISMVAAVPIVMSRFPDASSVRGQDSDEDADRLDYTGPDCFAEEPASDSCLAYRAPWATPPTATLDSGTTLTSLCKLRGYACITSPPLSVRSPDLDNSAYPPCRHQVPWDATRWSSPRVPQLAVGKSGLCSFIHIQPTCN